MFTIILSFNEKIKNDETLALKSYFLPFDI